MKFRVMQWIREVRDEQYKIGKNMSPDQEIEYTKEKAREFLKKSFKERTSK